MEDAKLNYLMRQTIQLAKQSNSEDDSPRPKVGAILADGNSGEILVVAYRGEVAGAHAEFTLLNKANAQGVDTRDRILLTTLEPCVQRGEGKIPCADRVAAAGLREIYIGTLDPNPLITGRGEMQLSYTEAHVGRYPM